MNNGRTGLLFVLLGMLSLWAGLIFGTIGAFQFLNPELFDFLPFFKSRPLHVSLVVAWIFLTAIGGIYYYLPNLNGVKLYSDRLPKWHLGIFIATGLTILGSYLVGKFGGREYWEFPPILSIPILISWILLGFNYFKTLFKVKNWPVYYWMWATGIVFFFITFCEANAWIVPYVRGNLVRELTLQWKSYGALVGSWNMLIYGTSIFLMEKISGSEQVSHSRLSFLMYFLGLTNLMFGWAHHTYIIPTAPWVKM
ncbi:MAG: cbb3-type cytochrome c oxidase subunit I, partial [Flavobacteriales bacterium]|nr:cbb3-type cytochrome c oxidase subunit I [Flavobacteriales bacterium]